MAEEQNPTLPPAGDAPGDDTPVDNAPVNETPADDGVDVPVRVNQPAPPAEGAPDDAADDAADDAGMADRLERLGGEPAPAISPEEFARLQQSGQIHIDSRGRIKSSRREEADAGMSLRKRRAWY